jgi:hypothetical protein
VGGSRTIRERYRLGRTPPIVRHLAALRLWLRALAYAHPHAYALLLNRQILPLAALRLWDVTLEQLQQAGFERRRAADIICTVSSYTIGYAMVELSALLPDQSERVPEGPMTDFGRLTQIMRRLPRETPARLVEVASVIMDCDLDAQFTFGLDLMLTSLRSRQE